MSKLIVYGGAFNPITIGHVEVAKKVISDLVKEDFIGVCFLPCYKSRWGKEMVLFENRFEMVKKAIEGIPMITCSGFEGINKETGGSYEIIIKMLKHYRRTDLSLEISFLIGMDHANVIHKWVESQKLINDFQFIVMDRTGVAPDPNVNWYKTKPHIYLSDGVGFKTSSTLARDEIKQFGYSDKVCAPVMEYIKEHKLYI